ncbi:hypothetical protein CR513_24601, partial [Mucuna pruriens]
MTKNLFTLDSIKPKALFTNLLVLNHLNKMEKLNNLSPFSFLYDKSLDLSHLHVFGSVCYTSTLVANRKKFHSRVRNCLFLGYRTSVKGFILFNLHNRKLFLSRNITFNETFFPFSKSMHFDITTQLSTICLPSNTTSPNLDNPNIFEPVPSNQLTQPNNTHISTLSNPFFYQTKTSPKLFERLSLQYSPLTTYNKSLIQYCISIFSFSHI